MLSTVENGSRGASKRAKTSQHRQSLRFLTTRGLWATYVLSPIGCHALAVTNGPRVVKERRDCLSPISCHLRLQLDSFLTVYLSVVSEQAALLSGGCGAQIPSAVKRYVHRVRVIQRNWRALSIKMKATLGVWDMQVFVGQLFVVLILFCCLLCLCTVTSAQCCCD